MTNVRRVIAVAVCVAAVGWSMNAAGEVTPGDEPRIELRDLEGEPIPLREHRGEVVIVDIWATWCRPCRRSMPFYRRLYHQYSDRGLRVLAVSVDESRGDVVEFRDRYELPFSVAVDENHRIAKSFAPPAMPTAYLIDRSGVVRHRHTGFRSGAEEAIEEKILELLEESPPHEDEEDKEQ